MMYRAPLLALWLASAIVSRVLGLNLLGDGLRDLMDLDRRAGALNTYGAAARALRNLAASCCPPPRARRGAARRRPSRWRAAKLGLIGEGRLRQVAHRRWPPWACCRGRRPSSDIRLNGDGSWNLPALPMSR